MTPDECTERCWKHYENALTLLDTVSEEKDTLDPINALVLVVGAATEAFLGHLIMNIPLRD